MKKSTDQLVRDLTHEAVAKSIANRVLNYKQAENNKFEKKLKSGLKKCPLHKYGSDYKYIAQGYLQCERCHGYIKTIVEGVTEDFSVFPRSGYQYWEAKS